MGRFLKSHKIVSPLENVRAASYRLWRNPLLHRTRLTTQLFLVQDGCLKALLNIPYSMRLLYIHSYCSLVWNQMASHRIRRYGRTAAVQGDLVIDKTINAHDLNRDTADSHDSDGNLCADETCGIRREHVRCVSDQDEGKYLLKDVVLPLPGYNVQYPENEIGEE